MLPSQHLTKLLTNMETLVEAAGIEPAINVTNTGKLSIL